MCKYLKTLSKVKSGKLSICCQCQLYHLEFNNIYLELNKNEFEHFKTYVLNIDMDYWEQKYAHLITKRKIPIPSIQQNLVLMFNREEIKELKTLLIYNRYNAFEDFINTPDIDYTLILN